jgi:hypothetical protein
MPIIERTARECFAVFSEHLRGLVAATVTSRPLQAIPAGTRLMISFREGNPVAVPIETAYGRLFFYLGQALEAAPEAGNYRLKTKQYWYRLQHEPELTAKAAIRWEYDTSTPRDGHARHHAQLAAGVRLGDRELDLDKAHLPSGWVTIEEVIRFLIYDLGVTPPCGDDWPKVIGASEERFFDEFTGKRHVPAEDAAPE